MTDPLLKYVTEVGLGSDGNSHQDTEVSNSIVPDKTIREEFSHHMYAYHHTCLGKEKYFAAC